MEFTSAGARDRYDRLVARLDEVVIGLDFDGVLSPIVEDPDQARIHVDAAQVLTGLSDLVRAVAVITGRPVRQALDLGDLAELGDAMGEHGTELFVLGQYGNERWSSTDHRFVSPRPPEGLASFERELPALLRRHGASEAFVEKKGLAVAVHTRRLSEAYETFERLLSPMTDLAHAHGLMVEPGRNVIEVRAQGMHKGHAVRALASEQQAGGFFFAGDDLGDLEAFEAVAELRRQGLATLLVCAASDEQSALMPLADVIVPGPDGVLDLLRHLAADARS